jgi:hypothetical protein
MAIGGFNGTDPAPTLAQFEAYVRGGDIHYFISSGFGGGVVVGGVLGGGGLGIGGGSAPSAASQITAWVESSYTATTVDGVTIYDLTAPPHAS